ncbi:MAG: NAD(P)-dependent oxidoreductase [Rhodoferax sp.]|nr:NAD(P)-dependent oxidoreductase [Rhodoferax sp.]
MTTAAPASRCVGLIGLGAMGQGVARNLLRKGFKVHGCDLRPDARAALVREGGQACATPADLGERCGAVIVLVVNAGQTEAVLFGPGGVAAQLRPGSVVILSATTPPAFVEKLGERLAALGLLLLDAPVTGGVTGAAQGTLTLLTSGPEPAYAACEDVLAAISTRGFRFGTAHGLGSKAKVINQLLVGVQIAAAAEAMALGLREGVDPQLLYQALQSGAASSWAFSDRVPRMISPEPGAQTALDIFVKDLGLVLDTARASAFPTPLASTAYQMFAIAAAAGLGREDDSAVIRIFPGIGRPPAGAA